MILINLKNYCLQALHKIDRLIAHCLIWLIIQLRPLLGPSSVCPFYMGCTEFALMQLENNHTPYAIYQICMRLLKCNPIWIWTQKN